MLSKDETVIVSVLEWGSVGIVVQPSKAILFQDSVEKKHHIYK